MIAVTIMPIFRLLFTVVSYRQRSSFPAESCNLPVECSVTVLTALLVLLLLLTQALQNNVFQHFVFCGQSGPQEVTTKIGYLRAVDQRSCMKIFRLQILLTRLPCKLLEVDR